VILGGIVLALTPTRAHPPRVKVRSWGVAFGVLAATGQGLGAVFSRKGFELSQAAGEHIDGLTVAFQRTLGGLVITGGLLAALWWFRRGREPATPRPPASAFLFILGNAFAGPILGMSSFQWALSTTPSGIVLPITATTPLVVIPFAYWLEGERPSQQSLVGGGIAVAGAVALALVR
jgi:drug/metabolite transporter (DMT)-like permease